MWNLLWASRGNMIWVILRHGMRWQNMLGRWWQQTYWLPTWNSASRTHPKGKAKQKMWACEKLLQTPCCMGIKGLGKRQSRGSLWRGTGRLWNYGGKVGWWLGPFISQLLKKSVWWSPKSRGVWGCCWESRQKEGSGPFTIKLLMCVRGEATWRESGLTHPALMKISARSFQKLQENP